MLNKHYFPVLISSVLVFLYCCKKDVKVTQATPPPPVLTDSFSALVDGVVFKSDPYSFDSLTGQYLGTYANNDTGLTPQLSVIGQKGNPTDTGHTSIIFFTASAAVQSFSSTASTSGTDYCILSYTHGSIDNPTIWHTDSTHTGTVTITKLDTIHNMVSGTFSFTAYSAGATPATHTITQGTFTNVPIEP